jgi:hypothetical protein
MFLFKKSLVINKNDNVAVLLEDARKGDAICVGGREIPLRENIEFGHKAALTDLAAEASVIKYGEEIGYMLSSITAGEWIHNHNMGCRRGR